MQQKAQENLEEGISYGYGQPNLRAQYPTQDLGSWVGHGPSYPQRAFPLGLGQLMWVDQIRVFSMEVGPRLG